MVHWQIYLLVRNNFINQRNVNALNNRGTQGMSSTDKYLKIRFVFIIQTQYWGMTFILLSTVQMDVTLSRDDEIHNLKIDSIIHQTYFAQ